MTPDTRSDHQAAAPGTTLRVAAVALVTAVGLLIAFWPQFSSGFAYFTGDRLDGIIAAAVHEHWYAFFSGQAGAWNKTFYFHPWPNTLALNDGYLLHGMLHAALRATGLPPLLSADIAGIILKAMLAPAAYLLARRHLSMSVAPSLLAGLLTLGAGNLAMATGHAQFFAAGPALVAALLTLEACRALREGRARHALATGIPAAVIAGLLLLTSFYVAYVLLLAIPLTLGWDLVLRALARQPVLPQGRAWIVPLLVIGAVGVVSLIPALILYLPQIRSGLHDIGAARAHAMTPIGLLDPGIRSILWSWANPGPTTTPDGPHGYGPLVLLAAFLGTVTAVIRAFRPGPGQASARLIAALGLVALGLMVLITAWPKVWLWSLVWRVVPGMGAFRVTSRWSLLLAPAVMLVAAWWVASLRARFGRLLPALLGLLLVVEQIVPLHVGANRREEEARLAAIPSPPADCRVFIATRPREGVTDSFILKIYSHNVDAMIAANVLRLPTINGFSTFNPPGWDLADTSGRRYADRARAEAERHNLNPCGLNFETLRWSPTGDPFRDVPPPPPPALRLQRGVSLTVTGANTELAETLIDGWSVIESNGVWSLGPRARILLPLQDGVTEGRLRLTGRGFARGAADQGVRPVLLSGPQNPVRVPVQEDISIDIPFTAADLREGALDVTLEIENPTAPAEPGQRGDQRPLGLFLKSIMVQ
ncbi:hypothetical protein [Roseomonas indoligenes]|uniref:Uncharacterized protein n=1 Tax=Roseomonas indoligenes TaxID=2820811 RepID=A0A940MTE9_9PROT|nr:hypothetical protein [Pararoseomonas indoligenes]MBP0493788.1 hypothetical protein [Pararoseomonas indoligenes]